MTNRITDIHPPDKPISDLSSQNMYRVEVSDIHNTMTTARSPGQSKNEIFFIIHVQEIRKEELHLKDSEALIPVAHFQKVSHGWFCDDGLKKDFKT